MSLVSVNLEIVDLLELVDMNICLLESVLFQQGFGVLSCVCNCLASHGLTLFGLELNQLHLVDWNSTFAVDPFIVDEVFVFVFHDYCNTLYSTICDKAKASWFIGLFVLEYDAVFQDAKVAEVVSELID